MIVCFCHGIRDEDIEHAIAAGAHSLDALEDKLALGAGCGICVEYAEARLSGGSTPSLLGPPATTSDPAMGSPGFASGSAAAVGST